VIVPVRLSGREVRCVTDFNSGTSKVMKQRIEGFISMALNILLDWYTGMGYSTLSLVM